MRVLMILLATAAMAGCASTAGMDRAESYQGQYSRLNADCTERGGSLVSSGQQTGRPQTDNVCKISGGPSDRLRDVTER